MELLEAGDKRIPTRMATSSLPKIGTGAFGGVFAYEFQPEGKGGKVTVALKVMKEIDACDADDEEDKNLQESLKREITNLGTLLHPNIVKLLFAVCPALKEGRNGRTAGQGMLGYQHCSETMERLWHQSQPSAVRAVIGRRAGTSAPDHKVHSAQNRIRNLVQVLNGLAHLHGKSIIHRDLKPDNVLLDATGRAVMSDFGSSVGVPIDNGSGNTASSTRHAKRLKITKSSHGKRQGTEGVFMLSTTNGPHIDMFSIGVIIGILVTRIDATLDFLDVKALPKRWSSIAESYGAAHGDAEFLHELLPFPNETKWWTAERPLPSGISRQATETFLNLQRPACAQTKRNGQRRRPRWTWYALFKPHIILAGAGPIAGARPMAPRLTTALCRPGQRGRATRNVCVWSLRRHAAREGADFRLRMVRLLGAADFDIRNALP